MRSTETKAKISKSLIGNIVSVETRSKMSASHIGKRVTAVPGYDMAHKRMRVLKTGKCAECKIKGYTDMALIHGRETIVNSQGRKYSIDPDDYRELCRPRHRVYDLPGKVLRQARQQARVRQYLSRRTWRSVKIGA